MNPAEILKSAETILVLDWPSREVPESLAQAGFEVIVKGGPGPEDYSAYELIDGKVVERTSQPPEHAEIVYSYRPLSELPGVIALAKSLGAKAIWTQSGQSDADTPHPNGCWLPDTDLRQARDLAEAAGLILITEPYIADVSRELQQVP